MCTAVSYKSKDHYFGRNLDLEHSYHETVTITPRNKAWYFRHIPELNRHYAMIGMAYVIDDYPLYYEATNEKGLSMAGLNFPSNACYNPVICGKDNLASYELIPWLLGKCKRVEEVRSILPHVNITDESFRPELPPSPLHWMISDREESIVLEQTRDGVQVYDDPVGVMTNNPTFDYQMLHLMDYMNCSPNPPENHLASGINLTPYSRGMGGMGIPGDLSSASRFVKAAFTTLNSLTDRTESGSITQFFKILGAVEQQKGCCRLGLDEEGAPVCEYTIYSSCCNTDTGIYYYTTYENSQITGVDMHKEDLEGMQTVSYELQTGQQIYMQN